MPKVSVIIPIYNAEKYLREALDSVICQTLFDIEVLCINDGSTDSSPDIIKEYADKDSRIVVINKTNAGYGATVNLGIDTANSEYIAIFEPDDILDKDMYSVLYEEAIKNDLDVVKCNFYNFWSKSGRAKRSGLVGKCAKKEIFNPKDNLKMFACHASVWAAIYKKSFLKDNDIKFLETPGASYQDMSFSFKVLATTDRIKLLDIPLLYYRQDNPMSSVNNPTKAFCVCDEYDELTTFLDKNPNLKENYNSQKLINQYNAYLWNIKRLDKSLQEPFLEKFSKTFKDFDLKGILDKYFYANIKKSDVELLINKPKQYLDTKVNKKGWYNIFAK